MNEFAEILNRLANFRNETNEIFGTKINPFNPKKKEQYQIGILTASVDEFESIKKYIYDCKEVKSEINDSTIYFKGTIKSPTKSFSAILPYPTETGIESAVCATTKLIVTFAPEYIFMVGILAGNKNVSKIGDIVVAEKALNYNEIVDQETSTGDNKKKFMQNAKHIDGRLKAQFTLFSKSKAIEDIQNEYNRKDLILNPLGCYLGVVVTGSSLVRSSTKMQEINEAYHNIKGLDMETHGFYYASTKTPNNFTPIFASIKSVSDFGDNTKHDINTATRREYALHTSSMALIKFIQGFL